MSAPLAQPQKPPPFAASTRLSVGMFSIFIVIGLYVPFLPVWLEGRGLSAQQVGIIFASALWARVPATLWLAHLAERSGRRKRILIATSVTVLAGFLAFTHLWGFWPILVGWLVVGTALTAMVPLSDGLALVAITRHGANYGRIRLWGSLSFILASFFGGHLLQGRPNDTILLLLIIGAACSVIGMAQLPDHRTMVRPKRRWAVVDLLRERRFIVFIVSAAFLQSSHAALYGFATLTWRKAGIADGTIGLLWAEGVIFEILLFTFARHILGRLEVWKLLMLAACAGIVRWSILGSTGALVFLIPAQSLHALTFAATHLAAVSFIARNVPDEQSASAQGLYSGVAMGIVFAVAMIVAGWAYQNYGPHAFYVMAGFSAMGGVAAFALGAMATPRPALPKDNF